MNVCGTGTVTMTVKNGEISKPQNFHQIFRFGECGGSVSHRMHYDRQNPKKKARHYWRCIVAAGKNNSSTCTAPSFREDYVEHNFMSALLAMKAEGSSLEQKVKIVIEEIEAAMEHLNQELYEAVDEELNQAGQDTKRVEALTNEIVQMKKQLDAYEERQEQAAKYREEFGG
ncbi:recombinase zinc beta ribbon domain-containing protein [Sporosarcina sp. OR05]|uniref:recombinase zinc beta ribbon domain-containing protein n=1 Tax=Sporosarcina sp. OR05 TaxID=2969819 RepID=UPI00352A8220